MAVVPFLLVLMLLAGGLALYCVVRRLRKHAVVFGLIEVVLAGFSVHVAHQWGEEMRAMVRMKQAMEGSASRPSATQP